MSTDLRDLIGKRVAAKRSGWDVPDEGVVTDTDILYPPPWRDEGQDEDVDGVLAVAETPAGPSFALVGGQPVDPATVRPAGGKSVKHGPPPKPGLVFDESTHRWVKPGEQSTPADEHTTTARGLAAKIKAYGQKAVDVALTVGAKAYELGLKAQWAVGGLDPAAVLDTVNDWGRITAFKANWFADHLGIGAQSATVVMSHILGYATVKAKQAIAKGQSTKGAGGDELATAVADVITTIFAAAGCPADQMPDKDEIVAWVRSRAA